MDISQIIATIYEVLLQFVPLFRVVWATTVVLGIVMMVIALILKKTLSEKNHLGLSGDLVCSW